MHFMFGETEPAVPGRAEEYRKQVRALEEELAGIRREQASVQCSFFEAAQIQRRLCAPRQYESPEFEVAGEIFPVRHLTGDFFKVFDLGSDLGVTLGDIAGKGFSAGIWMPHLVSLIVSCARDHFDPADAIAAANRELCFGCGEPPLAAVFFARLDRVSGEVAYCNAGLPSPLLLRRDHLLGNHPPQEGGALQLESGGPMLGATSAAKFQTGTALMELGDLLVACSDGVTECENASEREFALDGLQRAVRAFSVGSASQTLFSALGAVLDFADGRALRDDLTLLVVQRTAVRSNPEHAARCPFGTFLQ
jgi:sigma-B regulation protein RsbU (phosphoserine phosphatase)